MTRRHMGKRSVALTRGAVIAVSAVAMAGATVVAAPSIRAQSASLGLFSDTTAQFISPAEPAVNQPYQISLRGKAGQIQSATLNFGGTAYPMQKIHSDGLFDTYAATVPGQPYPQGYYFTVVATGGSKVYLSATGTSTFAPSSAQVFTVTPGFKTPAWATGAVYYEIFPDRFYNGDPSNDDVTNEFMYDGAPDVHVAKWNKPPDGSPYNLGGNRTREFYGGDLQGIIDKLPYLKSLGIQAIYMTPIFVAPSNHKYDTQDFAHVDPHLGKIVVDGGKTINPLLGMAANAGATKYITRTENSKNLQASDKVLQTLIAKAHSMGLKVILDGVFEDTGSFNKWFDQQHIYPNTPAVGPGAFESKNSPFHDFYNFSSDFWPNNNSYDSWEGISTLPKLNYENSPKLVKLIDNIAKKWVSAPYNADGWRLDSAANLGYSQAYNVHFWDQFRTAVKSANPNAVILAEWYNDPSLYFDGKGFDTIQNYSEFLTPVSNFLTGVGDYSDTSTPQSLDNVSNFLGNMESQMSLFPSQALFTAMNSLDNPDTSRFLTRTNGVVGSDDTGMTPAQASRVTKLNLLEQGGLLDMTWPGAPTVYYGDEAGLSGWTDPDSRRTFPWGHENQQLEGFYKSIIHTHTGTSSLMGGSLYLFPQTAQKILSYGRFDSASAAITVLNVGDKAQSVTLPAWELDEPAGTTWSVKSTVNGWSGGQTVVEQGGNITVIVAPHGGVLLTADKEHTS